jgi:hypothetical protein
VDAGGRNPPDLNFVVVHEQWMKRKASAAVRARELRLLTGRIKKAQCVGVVADHHSDSVVIKHLGRQSKKGPTATAKEKTLTVGTYSLGNLFVVYEIRRQVWR